jgi:predicted Zn-dependent peptidase
MTEAVAEKRRGTLDQVNDAFRRYIDPAQISIVQAGDFKKAGVWQ